MDLLKKLEDFISLSEDDREIERAKNKDLLLAELYRIIIRAEIVAVIKEYEHFKNKDIL